MLRSQAYQGCPQVSRRVPPLVLEQAMKDEGANISTVVRGVRQCNLFAETSASRTRERGYDRQ